MSPVKTNEREGTRAVLRHSRVSAYKVRQVLDQIRGQDVDRAAEVLTLGDREATVTVGKVLASAVANAVHNDGMDAEELYVSACYADEGTTLKRWRPRARGRATRVRKRTSHITIIVSRLPDDRIARRRSRQAASTAQRSRRVAGSRRRQRVESSTARPGTEEGRKQGSGAPEADEVVEEDLVEDQFDEVETDESDLDDVETDETETDELDELETDETETDELDDIEDDEFETEEADDVVGDDVEADETDVTAGDPVEGDETGGDEAAGADEKGE